MILIPQKLFDQKNVQTIMRDGNMCILKKSLQASITNSEGYITNHVIVLLHKGQQRIRTHHGDHVIVHPGEVLFIPRGLYYITDLISEDGALESTLFYLDDTIVQDYLSQVDIQEIKKSEIPEYLHFGSQPLIEQFSDALSGLYTRMNIKNDAILRLKLTEILHLIASVVSQQKFTSFLFQLSLPKKRNIKSFIEKNFDKPLKVEDYAYLTGRSVSTFRRDFKAQFSTTPKKWLKEKRIEKALHILERSDLSVTELAYEVGYENISYFIKAFKSQIGLSPKQYTLNKHRNQIRH